jgi:hypothetical protein
MLETTLVRRVAFMVMALVVCGLMGWGIASGQCPGWVTAAGAVLGVLSAGFGAWAALAPGEQVVALWRSAW